MSYNLDIHSLGLSISMTIQSFNHTSVLSKQMIDPLDVKQGDIAIDCTGGGGGHSALLLEKLGATGRLFCIDQDESAITHLRQRFQNEISQNRVVLIQAPFSQISDIAKEHNIEGKISAVIADLGVSSAQIDQSERGFSFRQAGPLDMRMNQNSPLSLDFVLKTYSVENLAQIFRDFGEEPKAKAIAKAIVKRREEQPFSDTLDLATVIAKAIPYSSKSKKHPATKAFQGLRIHINKELDELKSLLAQAFSLLKQDGFLAVISFHSLEDRIVKRFYQEKAFGKPKDPILQKLPIQNQEEELQAKILKPFPMVADEEETAKNPRARSAKLRILQKTVHL